MESQGEIEFVIHVDDVPWRKTQHPAWTVSGLVDLIDQARFAGLVLSIECSARTLAAYPRAREIVMVEGHRWGAFAVADSVHRVEYLRPPADLALKTATDLLKSGWKLKVS